MPRMNAPPDKLMTPSIALLLGTLLLGSPTLGGCAAMQRASQERLDNAVTVSAQTPLYEYRRVAFEPMACEGSMCERINGAELMRVLKKSMTAACYEVVDDSEMQRYYEYFARASGMRMVDFGLNQAGLPGFKMSVLDPMMQHVVVDELGLDGLAKTTLNIGQPDDITGFRTSTIDLQVIDAYGRHAIWHARLDTDLMEDNDATQSLSYLANELGAQIVKRASACGEPQSTPNYQVQSGLVQLPDRIYFDLGSAQLLPRSYPLLDDVALWLSNHSEVTHIDIEGHTDDIGDDGSNRLLSEQRAQAVQTYLTQRGVESRRLKPIGYGESQPLVANDNPINRAKNRRVDFRVVR